MKTDQTRWNRKYAQESYPTTPSEFVRQFYSLAPPGRALDIASGAGRHSIFLARKGFSVDAVDISDTGLSKFKDQYPGIVPICADLDTYEIPADRYSLIVNTRYLNRRLFPYICEGLIAGGILIFKSYLEVAGQTDHGIRSRDYLLRENELLHAFLRLRILFYQEAQDRTGKDGLVRYSASLVAMKPKSN